MSSESICNRPAVSTITRFLPSRAASSSDVRATWTGSFGPSLQVGRDEQHLETLTLQLARELAGSGRLSGALQPGEHHDGRRLRAHLELPGDSTERRHELFVHDLDDLLARAQALLHVRAVRPLLDPGDELLHELDVHVGFEQREPDLAGDFVDVLLAQPAAAAQAREDAVKTVGEGVE